MFSVLNLVCNFMQRSQVRIDFALHKGLYRLPCGDVYILYAEIRVNKALAILEFAVAKSLEFPVIK